MMATLFEKFAFMMQEIISLPGTWSEKKDAVKRHVDDKTLSEFISWFEEETDGIPIDEDDDEDEDVFDELEDDEEEDEWEGAV